MDAARVHGSAWCAILEQLLPEYLERAPLRRGPEAGQLRAFMLRATMLEERASTTNAAPLQVDHQIVPTWAKQSLRHDAHEATLQWQNPDDKETVFIMTSLQACSGAALPFACMMRGKSTRSDLMWAPS